ncbi:lyase family protein [uncultured Roseobacter sp.]|uniref:lyase family protein n=1 Tax=uncultured Roseobacter sp. TaxID=114847 RepID=UPI0026278724|nr:lyase family protein [uncultured Roseobacter sp.]
MAASVFDSPLFAQFCATGETGRLFTDSAALRAMLLVEGALARAQGAHGIIPEVSAAAIHRAGLEIQIDPGALAAATGQDGVCIPALVAAFRAEMKAPEHAQYIHWGATSQDIMDTGLMLRLRQALLLAEEDLGVIIRSLADQADAHAALPMAARTYGQHATPTSWGAVLAQWGMPLLDARDALPGLRASSLWVSLSGAAGTAAAFGSEAPAMRAALADGLGLGDPGRSWHTDRGPILRIAAWMGQVSAALAGMGESLIALSSSDVAEVRLDGTGASSTMPQKRNPVGPSLLVALSRQTHGLMGALQAGAVHQHQRDGTAWFTEWMALPQIVLGTAAALHQARAITAGLRPVPDRMAETIRGGLCHAEALSFALATTLPRLAAKEAATALCQSALESGTPLAELARARHPDLPADLFDPGAQLGQAPQEARAFVARARAG